MTRLIIIRHGETIWNSEFRFQGHSDIPLNEQGRVQAGKLAKRLESEKIDQIYASDLNRAVETAEIIANCHNKPVQKLDLLRETKFGAWEGLNFSEIQKKYPDVWEKWRDNPRDTIIPEGEALEEVAQRVMQGIKQIVAKHHDETIAVVTHGGAIRLILSEILDMDMQYIWRIRQDNAALNIIDFYGERIIVSLVNDISHLELGIPR